MSIRCLLGIHKWVTTTTERRKGGITLIVRTCHRCGEMRSNLEGRWIR